MDENMKNFNRDRTQKIRNKWIFHNSKLKTYWIVSVAENRIRKLKNRAIENIQIEAKRKITGQCKGYMWDVIKRTNVQLESQKEKREQMAKYFLKK